MSVNAALDTPYDRPPVDDVDALVSTLYAATRYAEQAADATLMAARIG